LAADRYIFQRVSGNLQYRRRYPTKLVEAGVYHRDDFKKSLGTRDPKLARRRARDISSQLEDEFEQKRRELESASGEQHSRLTPISSLSERELTEFISRRFVELEKAALDDGWRDHDPRSDGPLQDRIETIKVDHDVYCGSQHYEPINWADWLRSSLSEQGIEIDESGKKLVARLAKSLQRAYMESSWRTWRALEGNQLAWNDERFKGLGYDTTFPSWNPGVETAPAKGVAIDRLAASYIASKEKHAVSEASLAKYPGQFRVLKEFVGGPSISSISTEEACRLVGFLGTIPKNMTKRYGQNVSYEDAGALEAKEDQPSYISPKTQRDYFIGLTAILTHAVEMEWLPANPLRKKMVSRLLPKAKKRKPVVYSPDELTELFQSEEFLSQRQGKMKDGTAAQARFWVPLFCLFHGVRSNEACQLLVVDVVERDGIPCILIREEDDEGTRVKRLKTSSSERILPIHSKLLEIGFLRFVDSLRNSNQKFLFPELSRIEPRRKADAIGKWFARLKETVLGYPPGQRTKTLHSFRHLWRDQARNAEIEDGIQFALGGWSDSQNRNSAADYGTGYGIDILKSAVDKISYPDVDLSRLEP